MRNELNPKLRNLTAIHRKKSIAGFPVKYKLYVTTDNVIIIRALILVDDSEDMNLSEYRKLCTKFGKSLWYNSMGFRLDTMQDILEITNRIIEKTTD